MNQAIHCQCGTENPADARYCIACRTALTIATGPTVQLHTIRCRMCGAEAPAGSRFCPMCQAPFATSPATPRATGIPSWQPPRATGIPGWQRALLGVLMLLVGALALRFLPVGLLVLGALALVVIAVQSGDAGIIIGVAGVAGVAAIAAVLLRALPVPGLLLVLIGLPAVIAARRAHRHP